jgi:hypothetical protein
MAAEPPRARVSPWALATLVCGLSFLCPVAPLLGLVLGAVALADLRRRPWRRGGRMVAAGMLISVLALAGWAAAAWWWDVHARRPMLQGPLPELAAGLAGDTGGFQAGFFQPGGVQSGREEAAAFLEEISRRYGRLIGSSQRQERPTAGPGQDENKAADDRPPVTDFSRPRIKYTLHFDLGPVDADAEFVVTSPGVRGLVLKFSWLAIRDPQRGDLCYPPGTCWGGEEPGDGAAP